jgi:hypothetical protein
VREVVLTKGYIALVDDIDYEWITKYRWKALTTSGTTYAVRTARSPGSKTNDITLLMHREILKPDNDMVVDHIDGNGLNNQRSNIRQCSQSQNLINKKRKNGLSSIYKGIYWNKERNKWQAQIARPGMGNMYIGRYVSEIDAANAYDEMARIFHGEFAQLNNADVNI